MLISTMNDLPGHEIVSQIRFEAATQRAPRPRSGSRYLALMPSSLSAACT